MSKYRERGAYHFELFKKHGDPYREHVQDVLIHVTLASCHPDAPISGRVFEIGCGEGCIIDQFNKHGFSAFGIDTDPEAVRLGREKGLQITCDDIELVRCVEDCHIVLALDVLEHLSERAFRIALKHIDTCAQVVAAIAVPDRNDPHGVREFPTLDGVKALLSADRWKVVHAATRHARHFVVFKRKPL